MSGIEHVQDMLDAEGYNAFDLAESGFELLESEILLYHGRWQIDQLDVWADEEGHVFGIRYDVPATEYQDASAEPTVIPVTPKLSWWL